MNQTSHHCLGICLLIYVLRLNKGTLSRYRPDYEFIFMQFLDADVRQRDDKTLIDPLTVPLGFVSKPRSSTEVHSFVAETISSSLPG